MGKTNERGHFGEFGGQYVAETLMPALVELEKAFDEAWSDQSFIESAVHDTKTKTKGIKVIKTPDQQQWRAYQ